MHQFVILIFLIKSLNFLETESVSVLVPDPIVTPLDILAKAKNYYNDARLSLDIRKKKREKALNCSDELCVDRLIKAVPEICAGDETDFSKCALKMFMKGEDLEAFRTADWTVTAILFYKYVLDGAYSFALCSQYYDLSFNAVFFHRIKDTCQNVSNYFLEIASFMTDQMINRIVNSHPLIYKMNKYLHRNYLTMPLKTFFEFFPKTEPSSKDKTIHAVKYLYEYKKYIKLLLSDTSKRCLLLDEENRLNCILDRMDKLHKNIKIMFQNLEFYLDSISCKSTISLNPSLLSEKPSLVLKTHKMMWESLSFVTETLQIYSEDTYDQPIDILIEIEKLRAIAVAKFSGEILEKEPDSTEAADYEAVWGTGTSKEDFVWLTNV